MKYALPGLLCLAACGGPVELGPTDPQALRTTLDELAAFGEKHVGSPNGQAAADYITKRLTAIGVDEVHGETFSLPRWQLGTATMSITIEGKDTPMQFEVFEASGSGKVDGPLYWAGTAHEDALAKVDLTGQIAVVVRDSGYHRSAQLRSVAGRGAAAMLYVSTAPSNLRQVGSVRYGWESAVTIPAVSVGADDGAVLKTALQANKVVHGVIDVSVTSTPGIGKNIVARIEGERPEQIVVGAHYDTWFAGSSDNGGGVAELIALADRRVKRGKPQYTIVFVAYDGEEVALYGGYDYLRRHHIVAKDPILAVLNFESPSATDASIAGLARSSQPALDDALRAGALNDVYPLYAGLEVVPMIFGGIIPTDIQGIYRGGVPTVTTAESGPYYHTTEDTPDKVDLTILAQSTDGFDRALERIMQIEPSAFALPDGTLWTAEVRVGDGAAAGRYAIEATIHDQTGAPKSGVIAHVSVMVDDFTETGTAMATTDANGLARFDLAAASVSAGAGKRYAHVTAGPTYPLVERVLALP